MTAALIQPKMLAWARKRADFGVEDLAKKLNVSDADKIIAWEQGLDKPTFKQAQNAAKALHIPFGYLFLDSPPEEAPVIPDLRTVGDRTVFSYSLELKDVIADTQRKLEWYKNYLLEIGGEKLNFAGKFSLRDGYKKISRSLTEILDLQIADRKTSPNWETFLNILVERAEKSGITVLRSGKVGSNTKRVLDVNEFRGFAIYDELAPFIFINGTDAKAAQIFTLVHELAHIWLGESGVSNNSLAATAGPFNSIEKICNDIAAEVLVPQDDLLTRWQCKSDFEAQVTRLAAFYRVSAIVIARRLLDLNLIERETYWNYYQYQSALWQKASRKSKPGGSYYLTLPVNNSKTFTSAVLYSVLSHKTLFRDGARLLGIKPCNLNKLADTIGLL